MDLLVVWESNELHESVLKDNVYAIFSEVVNNCGKNMSIH